MGSLSHGFCFFPGNPKYEELADLAGLNRNYIGMVERQGNAPTADTLEAIAKALQVNAVRLSSTRIK